MIQNNYILIDDKPVIEPDILKWAEWYRKADRVVAKTEIDGVRVSTVFLGLDHSWNEDTPLLYETMVFGGPNDEDMDRCSTREQALIMHDNMVAQIKGEA